jgi:hypothetical protein
MRSLDRFYRLRFADERVLREWTMRALEAAAVRLDVGGGRRGPRHVVFVPLNPSPTGAVFGYLSEGARGVASGLAKGVELDGTVVTLGGLPDGLTLLSGRDGDAAEYSGRARG